jgi:signal transduction histidine kinase
MKEVISDTVTAMEQLFQERSIQVEARLPERVAAVSGDVDRIIQVMLNLLSNAAKFCEAGKGRIEVVLSERDGWLRVDVRDNGPGIRAEDQAIIFDKFRQAGDTLTDKPQGTGLGLPICRHIIEHHGGKLWVESRPGEGACFSFTLPIERADAGTPVAQAA